MFKVRHVVHALKHIVLRKLTHGDPEFKLDHIESNLKTLSIFSIRIVKLKIMIRHT